MAADRLRGHAQWINALAVNSTGTLVASALMITMYASGCTQIAGPSLYSNIPNHCALLLSPWMTSTSLAEVKMTGWVIPEDVLLQDAPKEQASEDTSSERASEEQATSKYQHGETYLVLASQVICS
ncbi:hypothetical protein K503DRAFT_802762 [Rhizopogon vinicolor AM-OR11-026]|uniref:Uncharacterized protein n=1 Tax=Rhizopogon vinicolor AM-OR11-026 TaxID=1314800 RepID=A0A1B7MSE3_9AGAM|nr:hypothetical protein K503DRAFT_802762 [Rhizopogon vinicolor AM-OR11-026]